MPQADMLDIIYNNFSYPVLFIWSLLEGETGLVLGGFLSREGRLDFAYVAAIAFCGAAISDTLLYTFGRFYESKANSVLGRYQSQLDKVHIWIRKYGGWVIIFDRFIYGTHIPSIILIGMAKYDFKKFILLESIGLGLWSVSFTSLGYFFGKEVISVIQFAQHNLLVIIILVIVFFLYKKRRDITEKQ